jgi:hypothetical protein
MRSNSREKAQEAKWSFFMHCNPSASRSPDKILSPPFCAKKPKSGQGLSREWKKRFQVYSPDNHSPDFGPLRPFGPFPSFL